VPVAGLALGKDCAIFPTGAKATVKKLCLANKKDLNPAYNICAAATNCL